MIPPEHRALSAGTLGVPEAHVNRRRIVAGLITDGTILGTDTTFRIGYECRVVFGRKRKKRKAA